MVEAKVSPRARRVQTVTCLLLLWSGGAAAQPSLGVLDDDVPVNALTLQPLWAETSAQVAARSPPLVGATIIDESVPSTIPQTLTAINALGQASTYTPAAPINAPTNPFFQALGSNNRTCQTCHQPDSGWSLTPKNIGKLFRSTPEAPLFRPIDGAVCGNAPTTTPADATKAYSLLLSKGLIRIFIPLPAQPSLQFSVTAVADPYHCTSDPTQGISSPTKGIVSVYRRPLPSTNLSFLSSFMWDGREPSLASQVTDAVAIHAQGVTPPSPDQIKQIVAFESELYSAQLVGQLVGSLNNLGAQGGPLAVSSTPFHLGINDVLGADPKGVPFNPSAMSLFVTWNLDADPNRAAVARGQNLFNEKPITITGVSGLNDQPGLATVAGTCTTCHDTPNIGNHSSKLPINIGVVAPTATGLDTTGLPVFTLHCDSGPLAGQIMQVTDPGKALISGQCADIGKMKGPILRNLAARPPYFHNGSAPDLSSVVLFYNTRFNIGLTALEQADLVAFLQAL